MSSNLSLITTKAVSAAQEVKGLAGKLVGPAFGEIGEALAEEIRIRFRLPRNIKLVERAKNILDREGVRPSAVRLKFLLPLLEANAIEDDDTMAERWASLLVSAADAKNTSNAEASFIEILKQLAPTHAFVLDVFYEQVDRNKLPPEQWSERGYSLSTLRSYLSKEVPQFDVAIDNLLRLQLVRYPTVQLGIANGQEVRFQVTSSDILCPTCLGYAFVSACQRGRTPRDMSYSVPGNSVSNVFWTQGGSLRLWAKDVDEALRNK